jgi:hypothetical protein
MTRDEFAERVAEVLEDNSSRCCDDYLDRLALTLALVKALYDEKEKET